MLDIFVISLILLATEHRSKHSVVTIAVVSRFLEAKQEKKSGNKGNRFAFPQPLCFPLLRGKLRF